jgi:APA family basic amino acid/polyamine antiporter
MLDNRSPKPGDKVVRPRRIKKFHLRRVLGVPAVFSAGYGNVGSSIYYALGIVALVAMGATPVALGIAGIIFLFTALTYAEGTSAMPEAGGSASFARHAFGNTAGFIAGWALMLSYIVTISISSYTIPPYLGLFWEPFKTSPVISTLTSVGIVFFLMVINVIGIKEASFVNISATIIDILTQVALVVIGFIMIFDYKLLWSRIFDYWPSTGNLILGVALATIAYTGIETMSQMAEETKKPEKNVPRALLTMIVIVLVLFAGISLVSLSVMPAEELATEWARDPVAGIAFYIPIDVLRAILKPLIAVLAGTILLIATNAGIIGISRLVFSQGTRGLVPPVLSRIHKKYKTPYVSIIVFSIIAVLLLLPGFTAIDIFKSLGALYAIGSLLSFMFAHASIIALRMTKPDLPRPFRLGWNIRIKGKEIPMTALIGFLAVTIIWVILLVDQVYSRWVGLAWMGIGLIIYWILLWRQHSKQKQWVTEPEKE